MKAKSEEYRCDACGKKSNSDKWQLQWLDDDTIELICPLCSGAEVYEYRYHLHHHVKEM